MKKAVKRFNSSQKKKLIQIDYNYKEARDRLTAKLAYAKKDLKKTRFKMKSYGSIEKLTYNITVAERNLSQHVNQREMMLVTIQSEMSQSGEPIDELYKRIVISAYYNLIKRARQLRSYSFFSVEDQVLKQFDGMDYYSDPIPVKWEIPLRRETFFKDDGGIFKCGVLFILTVKFERK